MVMDIKVPALPESVEDGAIASWSKQEGDSFERDEILVEIETDKVVLEVPAPDAGVLTKIKAKAGDTVKAGQIIGSYKKGAGSAKAAASGNGKAGKAEAPAAETPAAAAAEKEPAKAAAATGGGAAPKAGPAARLAAAEKGVNLDDLAKQSGSFITKDDVARFQAATGSTGPYKRVEKRVPITRLRASVAKRLVESQRTAAMLTTFNEVNMNPVMELRAKYKDEFVKTHNGTKLGFMSFFVKAATHALSKFPEVNSYIDEEEIVYHNYADIGIAVSSPRGLVVPVLRDAHLLSVAGIESTLADYAVQARDGKLALEDLQGGTFTISNGGVFGSLLSTPIINPPQTAILGMHKIQDRPVVVDGKIEILPMMYLALTYDHRMIDGKTAVQFLVSIKDYLENLGVVLLEI